MANGPRSGRLTRRQWATGLTSAAALASTTARAQTPAPQPPTPEAELQAARDQVAANVTALLGIEVPMTTEPAFQFKA
jgi:hypothetical protein